MAGRRPKPDHLKLVQGTYRADRARPDPAPRARPPKPAHLKGEAAKEWARIVKALDALGLVTTVDRAGLAVYCEMWAAHVDACEKVREWGSVVKSAAGQAVPSPWVRIRNETAEIMRKALIEFGMTPASRAKVAAGTDRSAHGSAPAFKRAT